VNAVEDRVRDAFAHVVVPEVPVPAVGALQRRARRHRLNQAGGALGVIATVGMCIVGGMSFGANSNATPHFAASGITRIPAHVMNGKAPQWLVAQQTLDGQTYRAASTLFGSEPCVNTNTGFGSCDPMGGDWPYNAIGDFGTGGVNPAVFAGRVPLDAATVTVTYDDRTVTTPAVRTPTSDRNRWFATFFTSDPLERPIVGVVDQAGEPVAAPGGAPAERTASQLSQVAGLPHQQYALRSAAGWQLNGFEQGGKTCLSLHRGMSAASAPTCLSPSTVPSQATPVTELQLPNGQTVVAGDAPVGVTGVAFERGSVEKQVSTVALPGDSTHVFWAMTVNTSQVSQPWLIATCSAGWNCWQQRTLNLDSAG
jgi:hypothetical protein